MASKKELEFEINLLKGMDKYLRDHVQDEEIFEAWIQVVPDEASEDDFYEIADDSESFREVLQLFAEILVQDENA